MPPLQSCFSWTCAMGPCPSCNRSQKLQGHTSSATFPQELQTFSCPYGKPFSEHRETSLTGDKHSPKDNKETVIICQQQMTALMRLRRMDYVTWEGYACVASWRNVLRKLQELTFWWFSYRPCILQTVFSEGPLRIASLLLSRWWEQTLRWCAVGKSGQWWVVAR